MSEVGAQKLDEQGNYVGEHDKVSTGVRALYAEKIPKCPLCEETFLYTKAAQASGECAKCRKAREKMERAVKREEEAEAKKAAKKAEADAQAQAKAEVGTSGSGAAEDGEIVSNEPDPDAE